MEKFDTNINIERNTNEKSLDNKEVFRNYFLQLGYLEKESLPLNPPEDDKTVPFIGSSINAFKEYLKKDESPKESFFILQPCIRTHDIVNGYDTNKIPFGMPFFHIYGTFSPAGTYAKTAEDALGFLTQECKINDKNILIKPTIPKNHKELLTPFVQLGAQVEVDESRYYEWRYGIEGIKGQGITIFIKDKLGEWWDIGNLVSISDNQDKEIAVEFGFGVEFFQAAITGCNDPFFASDISKITQIENDIQKKAITYLETALVSTSVFEQSHGRTKKMINRYVNLVHYLCKVSGYTREEIFDIAQEYAKISDTPIDIELFLKKYDLRSEIFTALENVLINIISKNINDIEAVSGIKDFLEKNGIRREELMVHIEGKYRDNIRIKNLCQNL